MHIILFGAPCVGKETQAKLLSKRFNIPHISTGDMFREAIAQKTEIGLKVKEILDSGKLVPDDLTNALVNSVIKSPKCANGFILDGYPRTINQAMILENLFKELNLNKIFILDIEANEDEIVRRLSNRRICKNCGALFTLLNNELPKKCSTCGIDDTLIQRDDDKEEVIRKRLAVYSEWTLPVLDYYKDKHTLIKIDGIGEIEEVNLRILNAINKV
ncbi:MAG: adenylate kinase [Ignavibacteria bacterium]|nr:adenylate kinase [Ignavibacteria bacterium]